LVLEIERGLVVRPALEWDVLVCSGMREFSLGVQRALCALAAKSGATQWQNFANAENRKILQGSSGGR
jgi:hypothetical protein